VGTSVNQRSPDTLNWRAAHAAYEDPSVPPDRVLQEIWRAASNQPEGDLAAMLGEPIVARLRDIAAQGRTPLEVATAVSREIAQSKQASLAADIARRAAVQAAGTPDPARTYSERVFAEASNYLLSRDLPGYVGEVGRNPTVADSYQFKQSVLNAAVEAVRQVGTPLVPTAEAWRNHAAAVIDSFKKRAT
jgi:hypothetical protein